MTQIEIVEGGRTVVGDQRALAVVGDQRAPAVIDPLVVEVLPARARRPLRYTWPAQAAAFGGLAVWLLATLSGILDGVLVAGVIDAPRVAWLALGIGQTVAMMATIPPHAGGYAAAQCTPTRNTITGR